MSPTLPVVILAGGLATRMRPWTEKIPKALLDVEGRPFIDWQLELLAAGGIRHAVICCGYLGEMLEEHVGQGERFGLRTDFSHDGPKLLGTAGAIRKALPLVGPEFFVLYGDSYLTCDYGRAEQHWRASGKTALMTVFHNLGQYDRSNVEFRDGEILVYDKKHMTPAMEHIDYGLGIFRATVFETLADDVPADLATVYQDLLARGELAAMEEPARFYEIGSVEGLEEFREYVRQLSGQD